MPTLSLAQDAHRPAQLSSGRWEGHPKAQAPGCGSLPSDAFLEGYVQQFLYTFRYFCTPQDFLHFLLDRISSTLSRYRLVRRVGKKACEGTQGPGSLARERTAGLGLPLQGTRAGAGAAEGQRAMEKALHTPLPPPTQAGIHSPSRAHQDPTSTFTKIYRRSLCVLQAWVEDCYTVDFTRNTGLLGRLEDFISSKVASAPLASQHSRLHRGRRCPDPPLCFSQILPLDGSAEHLLGLLEVGTDRRADGSPRGTDLEDPKEAEEDARPFNALCKRFSEDGISRKVGAFPREGLPCTSR